MLHFTQLLQLCVIWQGIARKQKAQVLHSSVPASIPHAVQAFLLLGPLVLCFVSKAGKLNHRLLERMRMLCFSQLLPKWWVAQLQFCMR